MRKIIILAALALVSGTAFLVMPSCSNTVRKKVTEINPEFAAYISAYTSGSISNKGTIRVVLATDYTGEVDLNQPSKLNIFSFTPFIEGETWWIDKRTIEFRPKEALPNGVKYTAEFDLGSIMDVPAEFSAFSFDFQTRQQHLSIMHDGLETPDYDDLKKQRLSGTIVLNDFADSAAVRKTFKAFQDGKELKISWNHAGGMMHRFTVINIKRGKKKSSVKLEWNGESIDSRDHASETIEVPALGDFKITNIKVVQEPEQMVVVHYSDPIMASQSFVGLVTLENSYNPTFVAEGHNLIIYPGQRLAGEKLIHVYPGVKNVLGYSCKDEEEVTLVFEELDPDVRAVGEGVIIPTSSEGVLFPFEAVNLNAVDVTITRIYENNIIQFLQANDLDGGSEMSRVGKNILTKKIELNPDGKLNLHDWNRFHIDLSSIIKVEEGAIYNVELKVKKEYSVYTCLDENGEEEETEEMTNLQTEDDQEWNEDGWYYSSYDYYDYYYDYDYGDYGDPCSEYYYYHKGLRKNILASDIGIIAKAGSDKIMNVYLSDIKTTDPIVGATLEFYDYQQQLLGTTTSDLEGSASIKLNSKPFVVIAKNGKQRGYMKLRDGEALSMSKFDVSGEYVQRGVKGFIYTERGVWRPGDSVYVSFMLEDENNLLPENHPVRFELINPSGVVTHKVSTAKNLNDHYDFRCATQTEDPTGYWTARVSVGNREYSKYLRIETIKPNRLKMYLDFGKEKLSALDANNKVKLNAKWLHGADASNLNAQVDVTVNQISTSFKNFKDYIFDDPIRSFSSEDQTVFDGQLDETGNAEFEASLSVGESAPGMLRAHFTTKVFEKGGGFSIDRSSVDYSPYTHYVGVKVPKGDMYGGTLVTDQDHVVNIATVDANGKGVSRRNIEVKVYKLNWRWWWDHYDYDLSSYITSNSAEIILDTKVNTTAGKGKFTLRVNRPSWGRYLVYIKDPESNHVTGKVVYIDWPYWARSNRKDNENATMLNMSIDKEKYNKGENVKVSFPSSEGGRALVSIESGSKVLETHWVETEKGETKYEFATTSDMAPNAYVNVTLVQPHSATKNDRPIRLYGVLPFTVEDKSTHLEPVIKCADVFRPESKVSVTVSEKTGKPMTYTLAIVDDGLLDLTKFKTPDPWPVFYAREALGVKTWDMYDNVMGAFADKMDKLLAIGGDGEGEGGKGAKANRFKPMVYFAGPFQTGGFGSKTHQIEIPNYVGSVRVMVVAGEEEAYGCAEKTVTVKNPLMVLATLPRVLGPGETVQLPVNVFAMEKHVKDVTVEIVPNEFFKPVGGTTKKIHFSKIGDEVVDFELKVAEKLGVGKVKVIVTGGKEKAKDEIEIDVRAPNPKVVDITEAMIEPGESWDSEIAFRGMDGTNKAILEVSSIPSINLDQRLKYLIQYPHGCIEQTTSGAFPQLFLVDLLDLNSNFKAEITKNINAAVKRISLFQTSSGGFGYWPGSSEVSEWGTNYAGHFLLEAEAKGYRIPSSLKSQWLKYQKQAAKDWNDTRNQNNDYYSQYDDHTQAYRLYTLALAKSPELGAMNRLRESKSLSNIARWRLAAAYQVAGQTESAKKLMAGASTKVEKYTELSYTFGNDIRDRAMILEVLALSKDKVKGLELMKQIAKELSNDNWMSTQTTAYCLIGISKFVGASNTDKTMKFTYTAGSVSESKSTQAVVFTNELKKAKNGDGLKIKNTGNSTLFVKFVAEGIPVAGDESSASNNVSVRVDYELPDGSPLDESKIEQGTDFIAVVTINNPGSRGYLSEMALNQIFPSGWEIHNSRMDEFTSAVETSAYTYQDYRDDRVYTYYNISASTSKTFRIKLNATYAGKFYLPTVSTDAMYDNSIHARTPGKWVEVVKPGWDLAGN